MNGALPTPHAVLQDHNRRLHEASQARRAGEAYRRMKIRRNLERAISETHRLDGDFRRLATEFVELATCADRRAVNRT